MTPSQIPVTLVTNSLKSSSLSRYPIRLSNHCIQGEV
jgi:hypothetical protein